MARAMICIRARSTSSRDHPLELRNSLMPSTHAVERQMASGPMVRARRWVRLSSRIVTMSFMRSRSFLAASSRRTGSFSSAHLLSRYLT